MLIKSNQSEFWRMCILTVEKVLKDHLYFYCWG